MTQKISLSDTNGNNHPTNPSITSAKNKWNKWSTKGYTVMPHVSPQSKKIAENYSLRPTDVVVLSFPKTGTTWTQTVCEQLRTNAEGYEGFNDITERQPWLEFAHDCGQNLDDEIYGMRPQNETNNNENNLKGPVLTPRIFKSHQLLSAINPGAKYLCIVRDPAATLMSWFDFQKAKGRPGYVEYADANEYIANRPELFSGNHIFGTNLWEMYEELWSARKDPSVKILVYEGLIADASHGYLNHFPILADFLGLTKKNKNEQDDEDQKELYQKVAKLVSREEMVKHVDLFDDHFIAEMGKKYGRALRIMEPAPKVRSKGKRVELNEATLEWLEDQWLEKMTPKTGHASYDQFATQLSELFFGETEEVEDSVSAELSVPSQSRRGSVVNRRKSSLVIDQMPGIRRRRESIAPHE